MASDYSSVSAGSARRGAGTRAPAYHEAWFGVSEVGTRACGRSCEWLGDGGDDDGAMFGVVAGVNKVNRPPESFDVAPLLSLQRLEAGAQARAVDGES